MKKTTKGAIAAGGAAVLLMGGAGTLAYWNATDTVAGTSISSGHLTLDATACKGTTGWKLDGNVAFDPTTDKLVPGDTLTKTCDVTVDVQGTHLKKVDIAATTPAGALSAPWDELSVVATVSGSPTGQSGLAVNQGPNTVPVSIAVTWGYGSAADNDLNKVPSLSKTLGDIGITVTQLHN